MFRYLVLLIALLVLFAACGDDDEDVQSDVSPTPSGASVEHDWSVQYIQLRDARELLTNLGLEGTSLSPDAYECIQSECPDDAPGDDSWGCLSILPTGDPADPEALRYPSDPPGWYSVGWHGAFRETYSAPPEPVVNDATITLEPRNDIACGAGYALKITAGEAVRFLADNGLEGAWNAQAQPMPTCPAAATCSIQGIPDDTTGCLSLSIHDQPAPTQSGPRPTIYVSWHSTGGPDHPDGVQLLYSTATALDSFEAIAASLEPSDCFESPGPTPDPYLSVHHTGVIKPSYWRLAEPSDGTRLEVSIAVGNSCDSFERIDVTETATSVTIETFSRQANEGPYHGCADILVGHEETVELDEPLGDRELLGCAPEEFWFLEDDIDCAEPGNI